MNRKGYLYALISSVLLGLMAIFVKIVLDRGVPVTDVIFFRFFLASAVLLIYLKIRGASLRVDRRQLLLLMLTGLVGYGVMNLCYYGPGRGGFLLLAFLPQPFCGKDPYCCRLCRRRRNADIPFGIGKFSLAGDCPCDSGRGILRSLRCVDGTPPVEGSFRNRRCILPFGFCFSVYACRGSGPWSPSSGAYDIVFFRHYGGRCGDLHRFCSDPISQFHCLYRFGAGNDPFHHGTGFCGSSRCGAALGIP